MNWNRSYGLRSYLKSSLWVVPFVAIPLAVVVSRLLHGLDAWLGRSLLDFGAKGAQILLEAFVTATLSFVVFTIGSLLVAVQVASAQMTPLIIATITTLFLTSFVSSGGSRAPPLSSSVDPDSPLDQLPELAADLVRSKPDLIIAVAAQAALAAKNATSDIPVVMLFVADPVGLGLASSLARPGGNMTGVTALVPGDFIGKMLGVFFERLCHGRSAWQLSSIH